MKIILFFLLMFSGQVLFSGNIEPEKEDFVVTKPLIVGEFISLFPDIACGQDVLIDAKTEIKEKEEDIVNREWEVKRIRYDFVFNEENGEDGELITDFMGYATHRYKGYSMAKDVRFHVCCRAYVEYYYDADGDGYSYSDDHESYKEIMIYVGEGYSPFFNIVGVTEIRQISNDDSLRVKGSIINDNISVIPGQKMSFIAYSNLVVPPSTEYFSFPPIRNPIWTLTEYDNENNIVYTCSNDRKFSYTIPENYNKTLPCKLRLKCSCGTSSVSIPIIVSKAYAKVYINTPPFNEIN